LTSAALDLKALFQAIEENNVKSVERLVKKQISMSTMWTAKVDDNEFKWTPLHAAAYYGRTRIIDIIVQHGGDVKLLDTLHKAVSN
jgi:ankyrin repeat protein